MVSRTTRIRISLAIEGEDEQALMKWFHSLLEEKKCNIYLDYKPLYGGGYEAMLKQAVKDHKNKDKKNTAKHYILLVDIDRAESHNDPWSIDQLIAEAKKQNFTVCLQVPNLEGVIYRMLPGKERTKPTASNAYTLLCKEWPEYENGLNAHMLRSKFSFDDLLRVANIDPELKKLLILIGLINKS